VLGSERRGDLHRFEELDEIAGRKQWGGLPWGGLPDRGGEMLGFGFRRGIPLPKRRRGRREQVDPVRLEGRELVAPHLEGGV